MKKLLLTFFVLISLGIYNYSYALSCPIKSGTDKVILDYIENNQKMISNITNELLADTSTSDNDDNEYLSLLNEAFYFGGFYSYNTYFSSFQITNEIPTEITRDYKLLEEQSKGLIDYYKSLNSSKVNNIIKNACDGIIGQCEYGTEKLPNLSAKGLVSQMLENNEKILHLYRLTVMGEAATEDLYNLILVNDDFVEKIQEKYGVDIVDGCNKEGEQYKQITESISKISELNKESEKGIQKWKDAWESLMGNKVDNEAKEEKENLKKELSTDGISTSSQEILNNNLDKYSQKGIDKNNNFINSSINSIYSKTANELIGWKKEISNNFFEDESYEEPNINDLKKISSNSFLSKKIQKDISSIYEKEIPFATISDIETEVLRAKIIETHFSLDNSINTLEKACKKSVEFCNRQDSGRGKCGDCK